MASYEIANTASGVSFGIYEGDSEYDALDAMARDAGYRDYAHADSVAPSRDGEVIATLVKRVSLEEMISQSTGDRA